MGLFGSDAPNVSKLARRGKLDPLRDALRYEEIVQDDDGREWDVGYPVRVEAAQALGQYEAAAVAGNLSEALDDRAPDVRLAAVEALGSLDAWIAGVPERLLECVVSRRTDNAEVAARALDVLVAWRTSGVAELFVERLLAADAPELDDGHLDALGRLLEADPRGAPVRDAVAERLLEQLRESTGGRAEAHAERLLAWLGTDATDKVLGALDNGTAAPGLVRAAGMLGDARAVAPVVRSLESNDPRVREAAAVAARALNHTQAVPALLTATQDDEQAVRDAASAALDRMGTAAVIAGLAAVVSSRGLLAVQGTALDGTVEQEIGEADGERELEQAAVDEPAVDEPAAVAEPAAPAPAPEPSPAPAAGTQPGHPAPVYPPAASRRRGGFVDRLLGRDY